MKMKGCTHQEVKDAEPQHVEGDADVAMVVKPVPHLNTHAATATTLNTHYHRNIKGTILRVKLLIINRSATITVHVNNCSDTQSFSTNMTSSKHSNSTTKHWTNKAL